MAAGSSRHSEVASLAKTLAAFGNPRRLDIVKRLAATEKFAGLSISELAEGTGLTRQATTKHLGALAEAGLVIRRQPGRATWYELNIEPVEGVIDTLSAVAKQRARSQQVLKSVKERLFGKAP